MSDIPCPGCGGVTHCSCSSIVGTALTAVRVRDAEIARLRAENSKLKSTDMAVAMTEMSLRDEITRLRAENIHLRRAGMDRPSAELHEAALAELRAENKRLRARVAELELEQK